MIVCGKRGYSVTCMSTHHELLTIMYMAVHHLPIPDLIDSPSLSSALLAIKKSWSSGRQEAVLK